MSKVFNRQGNVVATDAKYTGEEPTWEDVDSMTVGEIETRATKALKFYNYYCSTKDLMDDYITYLASENIDSKTQKAVKRFASDYFSFFTYTKIARMVNRGMPKDVENPIYSALYDGTQQIISKARVDAQGAAEVKEDTKPKAPVIPPMKRLEEKVHKEVICHIDWAQDDWLDNPHNIGALNVIQYMSGGNIPAKGCQFIYNYLDKDISLLQDAVDESCDQAVEAWSFLTRSQLKKWLKAFTTMRADVAKYEKQHKKAVVRKKKAVPAIKQIKNLKYNTDSTVSPAKIPGAMTVVLFNEKTRKLQKYVALTRDGVSVKGTSIKDFDEDKSYQITIRAKDVDSVYKPSIVKDMEKSTSKKSKVNGRVNEHCKIIIAK